MNPYNDFDGKVKWDRVKQDLQDAHKAVEDCIRQAQRFIDDPLTVGTAQMDVSIKAMLLAERFKDIEEATHVP